ncbi:MAG: hypothetical protein U1E65_16130 [Myxococcota bacterium]
MHVHRNPGPIAAPADSASAPVSKPASPPVTPPATTATAQLGDRYEATPVRHKARPHHVNTKALADFPSDALDAWPKLRAPEREKVLEEMKKRYGEDFTKSFQEYTKHPERRSDLTRTYGPGVGPSEERLRQQGFKPYARAYYNEIWVHPSGEMVQKVLDRKGPPTASAAPPPDPRVEQAKDTVEGMKAWPDDLSKMNPKSAEYGEAYTDFWSLLTQERDEIKDALKDPDLDGPSRQALEKELKAVEALNQERADRLPAEIVAPSGQDAIVFNDWLYLSDK